MNRYFLIICGISLLGIYSCGEKEKNQQSLSNKNNSNPQNHIPKNQNAIKEQKKSPSDFIPEGFVIHIYKGGYFTKGWNEIKGDLNKDGIEDKVLIIKETDKTNIVKDEYHGEIDRNRRGLIILFKNQNNYELAAKNYTCFSSENEDGGIYIAPELSVKIKKGNLYFSYEHGRYGHWEYIFKFQNSDFELIGYNEFSIGPINNRKTSVNFSTKEKRKIVYINNDEVVYDTKEKISLKRVIKLSEVEDFDELDMTEYVD